MHQVVEAVDTLGEVLKSVAHVDPVFMTTSDKATVLVELARLESRLTELRLRVLATAGDVAARDGARDTATWIAHTTHQRHREAASDARLATALNGPRPRLAQAMREGRVNPDQASVITRRLDDLPPDLPHEITAQAETTLVELADRFDPTALHRLGQRILHTVAPDIAEEHQARALADLDTSARRRQRLIMRAQGDGTTRLTALLPDPVAARLATYLHAFTNPRRPDGTPREAVDEAESTGNALRRVPFPRRAAEAFGQLLEALDPTRLPIHGGEATTIVITISLDSLRSDLATGTLEATLPGDTLNTLTAGDVRRLACNAHLIPAVLGGTSTVLDLGRRQRLFSSSQRMALGMAQRTCRAEGCTIPATWCEAHHRNPWSRGGRTDLADGELLCSRHHHLIHDPKYQTTTTPAGHRFQLRR